MLSYMANHKKIVKNKKVKNAIIVKRCQKG